MYEAEIPYLSLSQDQVDDLALGYGDASAITVLRQGQYGRTLQSLASILEIADAELIIPVIQLLDRSQEINPSSFSDVLSHPHVSVWAWTCLNELMGVYGADSIDKHVAHLSSIAAVVGYRCGVDFEIKVPITEGVVNFPGLGRAVLGSEALNDQALVVAIPGSLQVVYRDQVVTVQEDEQKQEPFDSWESIRRVSVEHDGLTLTVEIDDIDPYRGYYQYAYQLPVDERLDEVSFKSWVSNITSAWEFLVDNHKKYAEGMAAGLQVMVPMAERTNHRHDRPVHGFGAIALTNISPMWIAYAMLEEFQRAKVAALNYLFPMHKAIHEESVYFAPWTTAPRSFRQMLESFYALPVVTEYWKQQSEVTTDPERARKAQQLFILWCSRHDYLRRKLQDCGELTTFGIEFISYTQPDSHLRSLQNISTEAIQLARFTEIDNRICWRLQNLRPDSSFLQRTTEAWIASMSCPNISLKLHAYEGEFVTSWRPRRWLTVRKLSHPTDMEKFINSSEYLNQLNNDACLEDVLLVEGRFDEAKTMFLDRIRRQPNDLDAWAGLVMSHKEASVSSLLLTRFPEVVAALYQEIRRKIDITNMCPISLAQWLAVSLLHEDNEKFVPLPVHSHLVNQLVDWG